VPGDVLVVGAGRFEPTAVTLRDGTTLRPDMVIAATGYRPGLESMVGHLGALDEHGRPRVHGARTLPQAPDLYFVGITLELAGLLREIGLEAQRVGRALAAPRVAA
jgi:hypothetical protein